MKFFKLTALLLALLVMFAGFFSTTGCIQRPLLDIDIFSGDDDDYEDEDEDKDDDDDEDEDDDEEDDD